MVLEKMSIRIQARAGDSKWLNPRHPRWGGDDGGLLFVWVRGRNYELEKKPMLLGWGSPSSGYWIRAAPRSRHRGSPSGRPSPSAQARGLMTFPPFELRTAAIQVCPRTDFTSRSAYRTLSAASSAAPSSALDHGLGDNSELKAHADIILSALLP